jgi:hypothetical protein
MWTNQHTTLPCAALPGLRGDDAGCHSPGDSADLLSEAGEGGQLFGVHRWLIIGPRNSGSSVHIDPLGTSAWNTLLFGVKLWALFPPSVEEADLQLPVDTAGATTDGAEPEPVPVASCAAYWFSTVFPNLSKSTLRQCTQFQQQAGETVFVPAGWHHAVLNMDTTVCVTQNFASPGNYTEVARCLYESASSTGNAHDVDDWRDGVLDKWPHLADLLTRHCVHCGDGSRGNAIELLLDRPVCVSCQEERKDEYELISGAQALALYGLDLGEMDPDDTPPYLLKKAPASRRKVKFYLHAHVRDCLDEEEEED